jgi:hypothetical protein
MLRSVRTLAAVGVAIALFVLAVVCEPGPATPESPAPSGPRWWKGNLHTHSLWSDGDDYPEMIADWYKSHGYHFLAMTDHNRLSEGERWVDTTGEKSKAGGVALDKYLARFGPGWVERREFMGKPQVRLKPLAEFRTLLDDAGRFLMIQGEEISHQYAKAPVHINAINLRDVIKPVDGDSVEETIRVNYRAVGEQSKKAATRMIATLNHPNFGWGVQAEDMILTDELKFFEVFNGHPTVRNYGDATHVSCERIWDIVLALRLGKHRLPIVLGLATDDAHGYHAFGVGKVNPGRGWVMVRAAHLSPEAILRAMEAGEFYATSGVLLDDVQRDSKELRLAIHTEPGVTYKTQFIATMKDARFDSEPRRDAEGKELKVTRVYRDEIGQVIAEVEGANPRYAFTGQELYVRAKVISSKPHPNPYAKGDVESAWTQPIAP